MSINNQLNNERIQTNETEINISNPKFCAFCGKALEADFRKEFCSYCGKRVRGNSGFGASDISRLVSSFTTYGSVSSFITSRLITSASIVVLIILFFCNWATIANLW